MSFKSPNFGFLESHSPKLFEIVASAEILVLNDPPASIAKLRLFAEWMSNDVFARNGIDGIELSQMERLGQLRKSDLIPSGVGGMLDLLRLWGNDAVHRHMGDGKRAVHALATAHRLAIWFHKVVDGAELSSTQFLVPPDPSNASKELLDSLDEQRQLAAALKTELEHRSGIISSLEDATVYLRRQAKEAWDNARLYESEATSATEQLERERQSSAEQIAAWKRKAAEATPAENVQAFIDRGIRAAERLGVQTGRLDSVPLAQIRVQGPNSPCCKKTTLLVQKSRNSFVVKACCMECDQTWNLSREDFLTLDLWVSCPVCGMRMNPSRPQSYYGYKCDCGVTYLLASLLPCHTEL